MPSLKFDRWFLCGLLVLSGCSSVRDSLANRDNQRDTAPAASDSSFAADAALTTRCSAKLSLRT